MLPSYIAGLATDRILTPRLRGRLGRSPFPGSCRVAGNRLASVATHDVGFRSQGRSNSWTRVKAIILSLLGIGCSERGVAEENDHRFDVCELWCAERALDPECPSAPPGRTLEECVETCVSDDGATWLPNEDGEDQCAAEQISLLECEVSLSCEERDVYSEQVKMGETSEVAYCTDELVSVAGCFNENMDR